MPPKTPRPGRDGAESLALQAVAIIVGDDELLPRFLAFTGSGAEDLRHRITDPDFLGAVLDFVLENDATVQTLAQAAGVAPEAVSRARAELPGMPVDWSP